MRALEVRLIIRLIVSSLKKHKIFDKIWQGTLGYFDPIFGYSKNGNGSKRFNNYIDVFEVLLKIGIGTRLCNKIESWHLVFLYLGSWPISFICNIKLFTSWLTLYLLLSNLPSSIERESKPRRRRRWFQVTLRNKSSFLIEEAFTISHSTCSLVRCCSYNSLLPEGALFALSHFATPHQHQKISSTSFSLSLSLSLNLSFFCFAYQTMPFISS